MGNERPAGATLEIRNLRVCYGAHVAVDGVSLSLGADEILTLVGPTGCGKSTLLRTVAGLERPSGGSIQAPSWRVEPGRHVPPERRGTGLVFQDFALFPHLSVAANVGFRVRERSMVDHWLALLGLESHRDALPGTLSGGQKQRVALARALAHQPRLVLLDEPLSNIDAALKTSLRWEIREALKLAGVPALWVTHDQTEALAVGDRMAVMQAGRLQQVAAPEDCFQRPVSRFVAEFLGEAAYLPGHLEGGWVDTELGRHPALPDAGGGPECSGAVDLLLRPGDLGVELGARPNAHVLWGRYEGETWLYAVRLASGSTLKVRTPHDMRLAPGSGVGLHLTTRQPLPVFPATHPPHAVTRVA